MSDHRKYRKILAWLLVPLVVVVAAGAWYVFDPAFRPRSAPLDTAAAVPNDEFERRVRDYILNNPEVVMEAARRFEQAPS